MASYRGFLQHQLTCNCPNVMSTQKRPKKGPQLVLLSEESQQLPHELPRVLVNFEDRFHFPYAVSGPHKLRVATCL